MRVFAASLGCSETEYDDHYLLRFLRARAFIQDKAEKMFGDFIEWRKSNNVDNIKVSICLAVQDLKKRCPQPIHSARTSTSLSCLKSGSTTLTATTESISK